MKKLNKKGFTLVELLAVIVILAVIMVITIPTVLGSMNDAKDSAFKSAVSTIEDYMEKQIEACKFGNTTLMPFEDELFVKSGNPATVTSACDLLSSTTPANGQAIIKAAGYSTSDVTAITYDADSGKIKTATPGGQFKGANGYTNADVTAS